MPNNLDNRAAVFASRVFILLYVDKLFKDEVVYVPRAILASFNVHWYPDTDHAFQDNEEAVTYCTKLAQVLAALEYLVHDDFVHLHSVFMSEL